MRIACGLRSGCSWHIQGQCSVASPCHSLPQPSATDICIGTCSQVRTMAAASGDWLTEDKRLMLHAVYRVGDLEKTEVSTMPNPDTGQRR